MHVYHNRRKASKPPTACLWQICMAIITILLCGSLICSYISVQSGSILLEKNQSLIDNTGNTNEFFNMYNKIASYLPEILNYNYDYDDDYNYNYISKQLQVDGDKLKSNCGEDPHWTHLLFATHHKTGTVLFLEIREILNEYWRIKRINKQAIEMGHFRCESSRVLNKDRKTRFKFHRVLVIHSIRHPLDIILSGYNYHKQSNESWQSLKLHSKKFNSTNIIQSKKVCMI